MHYKYKYISHEVEFNGVACKKLGNPFFSKPIKNLG